MKKIIHRILAGSLSVSMLLGGSISVLAASECIVPETEVVTASADDLISNIQYEKERTSSHTEIERLSFNEVNGDRATIVTEIVDGVVMKIDNYVNGEFKFSTVNPNTNTFSISYTSLSEKQEAIMSARYTDKYGTWSDYEFMFNVQRTSKLPSITVQVIYNVLMGIVDFASGDAGGLLNDAQAICDALIDYGHSFGDPTEFYYDEFKYRRHTVSAPWYYQSKISVQIYENTSPRRFLKLVNYEGAPAEYPY